jgi:hypothetical protein
MHNTVKKINAAVSFNIIKTMAFDIFTNESDQSEAIAKMILLFKKKPFIRRPVGETPSRI